MNPDLNQSHLQQVLETYPGITGHYDEFLDKQGAVRPRWQGFIQALEHFGDGFLEQRENQLQQIVRDNGITYNVYSENESFNRPWVMDPLPLILSGSEWSFLESSLTQRVRLMQALFADIDGEQKVLSDQLLPPELILANPQFLFSLAGKQSEKDDHLQVYAADLARSPNGTWWVLSDRLESPSGLGYALENRSLSSRIYPGLLRQLGVRRMPGFIADLCESYEALPLNQTDNPRIVFLSPGPEHELYYEHSYLARNLGYSLVEGADLMVRDNRVFLKTINGVQPVDVIIRQVNSEHCDPLELHCESQSGVAGMVDVVRENRVTISNPLGTGVLETPALTAFLPSLCQSLLQEKLLLPSVATWWCDQPAEREKVLERLPELMIRSTFRTGHFKSHFAGDLSPESLDRLRDRIRTHPEQYSAQERIILSTTPVFQNGHIQPRQYLLRVFLMKKQGAWSLMPGGLVRLAQDESKPSFSLQQGGESKDLWVLDENDSAGVEETHAAAHSESFHIRRGDQDLSSRLADNFFWLGRYHERTENLTRVLQTIILGLKQEASVDETHSTLPFFRFFLDRDEIQALAPGDPPAFNPKKLEEILGIQFRDLRHAESLASNFRNLQRAAYRVKERLSVQIWKQMQRVRLLQQVITTRRPLFDEENQNLLEDTLEVMASLSGLVFENMTRGPSWYFLNLGRRIERGLAMTSLLRMILSSAKSQEDEALRKLLACADSGLTYRRRYLTNIQVDSVLDLLLLDPANPRSIAFQVESIAQASGALPHARAHGTPHPIDLATRRCLSRLGLVNLEDLLKIDAQSQRRRLRQFLQTVEEDFLKLSSEVHTHYFVQTKTSSELRPRTRKF